ncbi:hypothetical protein [Streptomyces sp. NBC_00582]|uniref:hypothetical protein n=1 Tax=Streptomyces sp. NBC_00582 TaxID=2975783 RepID=UPI002E820A8B|nr:hypothetical protein [Streptomyces sp. NBC_00582]WUB59747.1 hypothetical protein OG852_04725 [Streptomyces sp. NBC_00582]
MSARRPSPLLGAAGLTLGGPGVGWLAFDSDNQIAVFSIAWGLAVIAAVVQEIRARRRTPPGARPPLRFVTSE